ncbi:MAG: DNA ligase D [Candidatus Acidiferrales bacterium]
MRQLDPYRRKRRFDQTPEPAGKKAAARRNFFVVQKHAARRLHYDFRLSIDGVLKSWAVPKGPSLNPADKRLAVQTEDHPLEYGDFEGTIPEMQYGAGTVMVWDQGSFERVGEASAREQIRRGELKFTLHGQKLRGSFVLVKLRQSAKGNEWLLIKHRDPAADPNWNIDAHDGSALTGRLLDEIAEGLPAAHRLTAADLEGARKASLPQRVLPVLATLAEKPFSHADWLYEVKWDGVRVLARLKAGSLELRSRTGRVVTEQYPELSRLPDLLGAREAVLDGEVVVLGPGGRSDFERLQERMNVSRPPPALLRQAPITYFVFDLLYCDGYDLTRVPLSDRKRLLRQLLRWDDAVRYSDHQEEHGKELFELAREQGLEGIVAKHARSLYKGGRSPYWLKFKVRQELDAVIGGWTEPRGSREYFGALLVGLYEGGKLRFIGGVGSGFTQKTQKDIHTQLKKLETRRCPFDAVPETKEKAYWVEPSLVARVEFGGITQERRLRQPVFLGLRRDLDPKECRTELALPQSAPAPVVTAPAIAERVLRKKSDIERELLSGKADSVALELDGKRVRLSNLNKVYFPESGYTKRHLLAYYYRIADRVLPFLRQRALVLRRYPGGITGESFFQKEAGEAVPEWMETVGVYSEERRQEIRYFVANHVAALLYLTNLGCIDHNPWSNRTDDLEHPDYFFFDLDPAEGTRYATVVRVARALHEKLEAAGLTHYLKTSGATGMHIYIPLKPRYTYEQVRNFGQIVARLVAAKQPDWVTEERAVAKRARGKVYIDVFQNASGRPLAAAYTVRAFPRAPVSTPLDWAELKDTLRPEQFNLKTVPTRVEKGNDPWATFWKKRQTLDKAVEWLGRQVLQPPKKPTR